MSESAMMTQEQMLEMLEMLAMQKKMLAELTKQSEEKAALETKYKQQSEQIAMLSNELKRVKTDMNKDEFTEYGVYDWTEFQIGREKGYKNVIYFDINNLFARN